MDPQGRSYPTGDKRADAALNAMVRSADEIHLAARAAWRAAKTFWAATVEFHKAAWAHRSREREGDAS